MAFALAFTTTSATYGKQEYVKKEKKGCVYCHTKAAKGDAKDLTDAGKHYKEHHSFEGYKAKEK